MVAPGRPRQRQPERLAHRLLACKKVARGAALLVEYDMRQLDQSAPRLIERAAMGVHARNFLDEADVSGFALEKHGGESERVVFHGLSRGRRG
jgi:hypothetical protein